MLSFIIICFLLYKTLKLQRQIEEMDKEHRRLIADAGTALTQTIKIAFDTIKNINQKHERLSVIVKDSKEKIQNIMIGKRPDGNGGKMEKIARLKAAVDIARKNQKSLDDTEEEKNE